MDEASLGVVDVQFEGVRSAAPEWKSAAVRSAAPEWKSAAVNKVGETICYD